MNRKKAVPLTLGLLLVSFLPAHADKVGVPGVNGEKPKYFSGTYCLASGDGMIFGGDPLIARFIVKTELYIQGQLVKRWQGTPQDLIRRTSLACYFDSTHFADGSNVEVKFVIWDSLGVSTSATCVAPVYNKGAIFCRSDFGKYQSEDSASAIAAADTLSAAGYSLPWSYYIGNQSWAKSQVLDAYRRCTAFHIVTHGLQYESRSFLVDASGRDLFLPDSGDKIFGVDFESAKHDLFFDSYGNLTREPNNLAGIPQAKLVYLEACNSANDFFLGLSTLQPGLSAGKPYTYAGQAALAYQDSVSQAEAGKRAEAFWGSLRAGRTAYEAWMAVKDVLKNEWSFTSYGGKAVLFGDSYARLKGVYTGDFNIASTGWYR